MNVDNLTITQIARMVEDVEEGVESPFKSYAMIDALSKELKKALDQVKLIALEEAAKEGAKTFTSDGIKFEMRNGAARFSYKGISEWEASNAELKAIEEKYKGAFKATQNGATMIDDNTGEVMEMPKVTFSSDSLIVKK